MYSALRSRFFPLSAAAAAAVSGASLYSAWQSDPLSLGFAVQAEQVKGALDSNEWKSFKFVRKERITPNTFTYRFELPDNKPSGIVVSSCLLTKAMIPDEKGQPKMIIRPYTPTSPTDARGYLDLCVKVYPNGKMSQHIDNLKVGDTLDMKGPILKYPYTPNTKQHIVLIAGGTGITPMMQMLEGILENPSDTTKVTLVFANNTRKDIIMKGKLDGLQKQHHERFKVYYIVAKSGWGMLWKGATGHLDKAMLETWLPKPGAGTLAMVCGPPGFMKHVSGDKAPDYSQGEVSGLLKELGWSESNVYKF